MVIADTRKLIAYFGYNLQRLSQRSRFRSMTPPQEGWPILLGISFPKSGTNLLRQILAGFSQVGPFVDRSFDVFATFDPVTGRKKDPREAITFLNSLQEGDIAAAHLLTSPEVVSRVCSSTYIPYFIYRDPRDVVVSHVFYVTERATEHIHHSYYAENLTNFDERLRTSILGLPDSPIPFPNIRQRYEPYLGWIDHIEVLSLRFEDLVNQRRMALNRILEHFTDRFQLEESSEGMLDVLDASIDPQKSPTFRSGKVGEWSKYFSDENKRLFKDVCGDLLIRMGYEDDDGW